MPGATSFAIICFFSLIGLAFFVYGKKATELWFLVAGVLLMIYPYFVAGVWLILIIGALLTAAPFVIRHFGL